MNLAALPGTGQRPRLRTPAQYPAVETIWLPDRLEAVLPVFRRHLEKEVADTRLPHIAMSTWPATGGSLSTFSHPLTGGFGAEPAGGVGSGPTTAAITRKAS